jgi:hypothetical protein
MQPAEGRRTKNKSAPIEKKCEGKQTGVTNMKIYFNKAHIFFGT